MQLLARPRLPLREDARDLLAGVDRVVGARRRRRRLAARRRAPPPRTLRGIRRPCDPPNGPAENPRAVRRRKQVRPRRPPGRTRVGRAGTVCRDPAPRPGRYERVRRRPRGRERRPRSSWGRPNGPGASCSVYCFASCPRRRVPHASGLTREFSSTPGAPFYRARPSASAGRARSAGAASSATTSCFTSHRATPSSASATPEASTPASTPPRRSTSSSSFASHVRPLSFRSVTFVYGERADVGRRTRARPNPSESRTTRRSSPYEGRL